MIFKDLQNVSYSIDSTSFGFSSFFIFLEGLCFLLGFYVAKCYRNKHIDLKDAKKKPTNNLTLQLSTRNFHYFD
jgi:hypothetical protein